MFHPSQYTNIGLEGSLAARGVDFVYHGTAAHAALAPWEGVNALDGVLLDLGLPNKDGLEVLKALRRRGERADAAVDEEPHRETRPKRCHGGVTSASSAMKARIVGAG